ncbi:hypothetical protein [Streptomyces chartreusis]|uniref:hypothetical protein n=1 Tax=Streptomyces chartreusis TaxID=1969 RepID=UPI00399A186B
MLAAIGVDRDGFGSARGMNACACSAPMTRASGKKHHVGRECGDWHVRARRRRFNRVMGPGSCTASSEGGRGVVSGSGRRENRPVEDVQTLVQFAVSYGQRRQQLDDLPLRS